eukprot:SAG22_NODE_155_length_17123_cov_37.528489_16_plen_76_part_00
MLVAGKPVIEVGAEVQHHVHRRRGVVVEREASHAVLELVRRVDALGAEVVELVVPVVLELEEADDLEKPHGKALS